MVLSPRMLNTKLETQLFSFRTSRRTRESQGFSIPLCSFFFFIFFRFFAFAISRALKLWWLPPAWVSLSIHDCTGCINRGTRKVCGPDEKRRSCGFRCRDHDSYTQRKLSVSRVSSISFLIVFEFSSENFMCKFSSKMNNQPPERNRI